MTMYKKLLTRIMFKGTLWFTLYVFLIFIFYWILDSKIAALVFALAIVLKVTAKNNKIKSNHRNVISKLLVAGGENINLQSPFLEGKLKSEWEKGSSTINDIIFVGWVKVTGDGVNLFLISNASKKIILIPWHNIQSINHCHYFFDGKPTALMEIHLHENGIEMYIPWRSDFNRFVPNKVGIS